jgi:hypothetical protein
LARHADDADTLGSSCGLALSPFAAKATIHMP